MKDSTMRETRTRGSPLKESPRKPVTKKQTLTKTSSNKLHKDPVERSSPQVSKNFYQPQNDKYDQNSNVVEDS